MISLKRNTKGELVPAKGLRTRASSIYSPNQEGSFRISRSKFSDFLTCQRCFYLDRVKGLASPSMPGWTLNETTDHLLKKEFDRCREEGVPHRLFAEFGLDHVVPFNHPDMDKWRDSLHHGLEYPLEGSNIILHGGVDDIWIDTTSEELVVVDYKSQANNRPVTPEFYLRAVHHQGYKVQMDFYAYLLMNMGFKVSPTGYFYVCNADRNIDGFYGAMTFSETLIPYSWSTDWIEPKLRDMVNTINSYAIPDGNEACENCAYASQRALMEASAH